MLIHYFVMTTGLFISCISRGWVDGALVCLICYITTFALKGTTGLM